MKDNYLERTLALLHNEGYESLKEKKVLIVGLGGVGGTALEALFRSGISHFIIIDCDTIEPSNLNRQILYAENDIGQLKVDVATKHLLNIDSSADITSYNLKIGSDENELFSLLHHINPDFIIDAIDDVKGKVLLAKYSLTNNIPYITSLGMANRLDPTKVTVKKLNQTTADPLAKKFRYELRKEGLDTSLIHCVVSLETPLSDGNKLNSMMMVPSSAGLAIAYYVISYFVKSNSDDIIEKE